MSDPSYDWTLPKNIKEVEEWGVLKQKISPFLDIQTKVNDAHLLLDLLQEEYQEDLENELISLVSVLNQTLLTYENQLYLRDPYDHHASILEISSGSGGIEAQDFALKLFEMYVRFLTKQGLEFDISYFQPGVEAGIKSAVLTIHSAHTYGLLRMEKGIHRLSRISPFDASGRRHTSFASVNVIPIMDEQLSIVIRDEDLKIDVFRSSGAGGQHVNVTDSAVRMTHKPTGIVVGCQSERSQIFNRQKALKILYSKLYERERVQREEQLAVIQGNKKTASFGHQIRSYVLNPYTLIKDHRSGFSSKHVETILNGDLSDLLRSFR